MAEFAYESIVIVQMHPDNTVTMESLSVMQNECVLSGAWEFDNKEIEEIKTVLSGRLVITLGNQEEFINFIKDPSLIYLNMEPFLKEARTAAYNALRLFEDYKSQDLIKRKKLVEPNFFNWPENIDLNKSVEILESMNKMATPSNTPDKMRRMLAASRLLKFLIDMWQSDEQERKNRKYVEDETLTILPNCWLKKVS